MELAMELAMARVTGSEIGVRVTGSAMARVTELATVQAPDSKVARVLHLNLLRFAKLRRVKTLTRPLVLVAIVQSAKTTAA